MCMADGGESYYPYSQAIRTARKQHACGECGRKIAPGERYTYCSGMLEGIWNEHKVCAHCETAMRWLGQNCGGFIFECMIEDVQEHIREYPTLGRSLARVVVGARRKWKRFETDALMPVMPLPKSIASYVNG